MPCRGEGKCEIAKTFNWEWQHSFLTELVEQVPLAGNFVTCSILAKASWQEVVSLIHTTPFPSLLMSGKIGTNSQWTKGALIVHSYNFSNRSPHGQLLWPFLQCCHAQHFMAKQTLIDRVT